MTDHVIVTDEDATRVITLRRPDKKNALTQAMYATMTEAITSAQARPDIRSIVISGGSGVFTAGNDLEDFARANSAGTDDALGSISDASGAAVMPCRSSESPTVA